MADDLDVLLACRSWVKRRVDRIEFLDLMTVRRTIEFTLDLAVLDAVRSRGQDEPIPLGWFIPFAHAGAVLLDARGRTIPYLTSQESDDLIGRQIRTRLRDLGMGSSTRLVREVRDHRDKADDPRSACGCWAGEACRSRYEELVNEKWGCRTVRRLLGRLHDKARRSGRRDRKAAGQLAQVLLAWQTNFVLFVPRDGVSACGGRATLQLSYDEELRAWEPPWEQLERVLGGPDDLSGEEALECRSHISYGGPFSDDLDALIPTGARGFLARRKWLWLRRLGRRGVLGLAWHVAWHQASGLDAARHHVEVFLPAELTAVRIRMLRERDGRRYATRADQAGSRATIVAPELPHEGEANAPPLPTLFSLVITQRSAAPWYGGVWLALLTGLALLFAALWRLPQILTQPNTAGAMLIVAPTLVATLLAVRAGNEISEQLTARLRPLIAAVGVLAALCAVSLAVQRAPAEPGPFDRLLGISASMPDPAALRWLWIGVAIVLLAIATVLFVGARLIHRFIVYGQHPSPRVVERPCVGDVLNPVRAPKIPPPDRWLAAGEGDLIPWGWLNGPPDQANRSRTDACFWQSTCHEALVRWVQEIFHYKARAAR